MTAVAGQAQDAVPLFERYGAADVAALIAEYPLAWISAPAFGEASLLPLLGEYDDRGELVSLVGHIPRRDPLYSALRASSAASILFQGPQGYVSPTHARRRDWAPTWNFAQLRIDANIDFAAVSTEWAIETLVDHMEAPFATPWAMDELGARTAAMMPQIIGFRAIVSRVRGRFKLGQDENPETLRSILDGLPATDLVRWMRRFNEGRIG